MDDASEDDLGLEPESVEDTPIVEPPEFIEDEAVLDSLLTEEKGNWAMLDIDPHQLNIEPLMVRAQLNTVQVLLMELGIEESRIDILFKNKYLQVLRESRTDLEPIVREARMRARGIHVEPATIVDAQGKTLLQ